MACISTGFCTAVGDSWTTTGGTQPLIESSNRDVWSVVPSPNTGTDGDLLNGVACASVKWCVAVGSSNNNLGAVTQTLIESWNGTNWSIVPSPNAATYGDALNGVTCLSASSCVAVGYFVNSVSILQTLIESWDGTAWSIDPSPNYGSNNNVLDGVSCVSVSFCTAVGGHAYISPDRFVTLVEMWNGTNWSVVPSPNPKKGTTADALLAVSCLSVTACTAVGHYDNSSVELTLIESWNGTRWSIVPSPNVGAAINDLSGVSCVSGGLCRAVGNHQAGTADQRTLIESGQGNRWSIVPSPNAPRQDGLMSVSCVSVNSCDAVGSSTSAQGTGRTLVESRR